MKGEQASSAFAPRFIRLPPSHRSCLAPLACLCGGPRVALPGGVVKGGFKPLITQRWWEGTRDLQLAASLLRAHESRTHSSTHRFPPPDSDILTETFTLICWHLSNHGSPTHPLHPAKATFTYKQKKA